MYIAQWTVIPYIFKGLGLAACINSISSHSYLFKNKANGIFTLYVQRKDVLIKSLVQRSKHAGVLHFYYPFISPLLILPLQKDTIMPMNE